MNQKKNVLFILSVLIGLLSIVAAAIGIFSNSVHAFDPIVTSFGEKIQLFQKGIYARDSVSMATQAIAQDKVTLFLGIPVLFLSAFLAKRENKIGKYMLAGTIGYFLYTYTSYSILMTYNDIYMICLLLMILSFYAFLISIGMLMKDTTIEKITSIFPTRMIRNFLIITGIAILFMWLGRIVPTIGKDVAPVGLEQYSTLGIQTLDLGFVVPACFVIAFLLHKKDVKGYVFSIVLVMKAEMMTLAVSTMAISMKISGIEISMVELIFFPILFLICTFFLVKIIVVINRAGKC